MLQSTFAALVPSVAFVALVAGCAGPSASISSGTSAPVAIALAPASELAGTWRGSFGRVSSDYYMDEADCSVQINEDRMFTAPSRPSKAGRTTSRKRRPGPGRWSRAETESLSGARRRRGSRSVVPATRCTGWPKTLW
jgi:hypothetical protein